MEFKNTPINISRPVAQTSKVNISMDVKVLAELIKQGHLCAADLRTLDKPSHKIISSVLLDVCAEQLGGLSKRCDECDSQNVCQKLGSIAFK